MLGPAVLYSALVRALRRLAERAPLVVVVDDAHLAGEALPDWLRFARREHFTVLVVAAVRSGEGEPLPATAFGTLARWVGTRPPSWSAGNGQRAGSTSCTPGPGAPAVPDRAGPAGRGNGTARVAGRVGIGAVRR